MSFAQWSLTHIKACFLLLGRNGLESDNSVCMPVICRAQGIVPYQCHEGDVRVSDKWCSGDISDSPGMACPWWQCSDHTLVGKPALPTTVGFLDDALCNITQKECLAVSPTMGLLVLGLALPNRHLAFGTEGGWAWACFPSRNGKLISSRAVALSPAKSVTEKCPEILVGNPPVQGRL